MKRFIPRPWQSSLLLIALGPLFLDGCLAIGVSRSKTDGAPANTGTLEVGVFEKPDDTTPTTRQVATQLVRLESGVEKPVYESNSSTWTQESLPAGRYRLRVVRWNDETGKAKNVSSGGQESFRIRSGERAQARVILKKFPTAAVVTIGVVVVAAVVVAVVVSAFRGCCTLSFGGVKSRTRTEIVRYPRQDDHLRNPIRSAR